MTSVSKVKAQLSHRLDGVYESATLKLNATVQAMKAQGIPVINLTAGEPDFSVHEIAKKAASDAILADQSKYTAAAGIPQLREAVAKRTNSQQPQLEQTRPWKSSNVIITNGAKQAIFNACLAVLDSGDEVIIPSPYWLSYPDMAKLAGGVPKIIESSKSSQLKLTPEQLKAALNSKSKMLILNSPNNPTGMMYSQSEFRALAEVLLSHPNGKNVWVLSDEIYDEIYLGKTSFCSFLKAAPELRDQTITVNGMSKSNAMTGWRVGWSVAPEDITQAMLTIQGQSTSGINSVAQWASFAAFSIPESFYEEKRQIYKKKLNILLENLKKARKLEVVVPEGAFYVFVGIQNCLRSGEDSLKFCERVLEEAKVAVVPGTPFGDQQAIRISFATDERSLEEGSKRLIEYLGDA